MSIKDMMRFQGACNKRLRHAQEHSSAPAAPERRSRPSVRGIRCHTHPRDRVEFSHDTPAHSGKIPKAIPVEVRRARPLAIPKAIPVEVLRALPVSIPKARPVEVRRALPVDIPKAIPVEVRRALPVDIPKARPVEVRRALPVEIPKAIPVKVGRLGGLSSLASRSKLTLGDKLAADAERICQTGAVRVKPDRLLCYRGVKAALLCNGIILSGKDRGGAYAWQAADKLAQDSRFQEIRVDRSGSQAGKLAAPRFADRWGRLQSLEHLPAGAIVVWGKGQTPEAGLKYGHISIALGDGREASDRFRPQMQNLPAHCRIFLPRP